MVAIKGMEMPTSCCEFHKDTNLVIHCPLYNFCDKRTTVKVNFKPIDCPLVEIVTCQDCKHCHPDEDGRGYHCERDNYVRFSVHRDFFCKGGEKKIK